MLFCLPKFASSLQFPASFHHAVLFLRLDETMKASVSLIWLVAWAKVAWAAAAGNADKARDLCVSARPMRSSEMAFSHLESAMASNEVMFVGGSSGTCQMHERHGAASVE